MTFATNYQEDPAQTATVFARFDDAEPDELHAYSSIVNRVESLSVPVASGAATVRFGVRYVGSNGSFRSVDQVAFARESLGPGETEPPIAEGDDLLAWMLPATGASPGVSVALSAMSLALGALTVFRVRCRTSQGLGHPHQTEPGDNLH